MVFLFKDTFVTDNAKNIKDGTVFKRTDFHTSSKITPYKPDFNKIDNLLNCDIKIKSLKSKLDESFSIRPAVYYNGRTDVILPNFKRDLKFWEITCR